MRQPKQVRGRHTGRVTRKHTRGGGRRATTRVVGVALAATAAALALGIAQAGPVLASPIASKKRQAAEISSQIHEFDARLETSIERYNRATARLRDVRAALKENRALLVLARRNLAIARAQLADVLVASYKNTNSADPAVFVMGAASFSDLLGRVELLQRTENAHADLVDQISSGEREIAARQAKLRAGEAEAEKLVATRAAQKSAVEAKLAERRRLLASVKGDIRRLIAEQERRQEQAAAATAAEAAAGTSSSGSSDGYAGGSPPSNGSLGQQAVQVAMQYLGVPYVWGGASPSGFDCSGLTMYAYAQLGISLPHYTGAQWNAGPHVSRDQLQPGDLVFFTPSLGHMGMYVGDGSFIHAPHTGDVVKISSLADPWYSSEYQGAVRVMG